MKRLLHISFLLLMAPTAAFGQGKSFEKGSKESRSIQLVGSPNLQLTLSASGLGDDNAEDTDDSTVLMWSEGESRSKITVSTFSPGQQFDLYVEADDVDNGRGAGRVKLVDGMRDTDLVVGMNKNKSGSARIVYSARASVSDGNSQSGFSDVHTVTYTVTDM